MSTTAIFSEKYEDATADTAPINLAPMKKGGQLWNALAYSSYGYDYCKPNEWSLKSSWYPGVMPYTSVCATTDGKCNIGKVGNTNPVIGEKYRTTQYTNEDPDHYGGWMTTRSVSQLNNTVKDIECTYDVSNIKTHQQVTNFKKKFIDKDGGISQRGESGQIIDNSKALDTVMDTFCTTINDNCQLDSHGKPVDSCLNLHSKDKSGELCRDWYNKLPEADQTTFMQDYCIKNPHKPTCACVSRKLNPDYRRYAKEMNDLGHNTQDQCWYIPCKAGGSSVFIPPEMKPSPYANPCPSVMCSVFMGSSGTVGGGVNISGNNTNISCQEDNVVNKVHNLPRHPFQPCQPCQPCQL